MAAAVVPTVEPDSFYAGDTVTWKIANEDYPASAGWTLKYTLVNADGKISISSTADGADHLVELSAATTAAYDAGEYAWTSYVEDSGPTERYHIGDGVLVIKADYSAESAYDARSWVKVTLDAIRARLYGDASEAQLQRRVGDLTIAEIPLKDLLDLEQRLNSRYLQEQAESDLDNDRATSNKIRVRFTG